MTEFSGIAMGSRQDDRVGEGTAGLLSSAHSLMSMSQEGEGGILVSTIMAQHLCVCWDRGQSLHPSSS